MNTKPLIVWEKWVDPFGKNIDEAKWTDYNNHIIDFNNLEEEYEDEDLEDIDEDLDNLPQFHGISGDPIKVIASPLGLIPYNEHTASSKIFNFWIGHTNFNISQKVKQNIELIDGVEILDIFTRYRFRIAIGKCFTDSEVMLNINQRIYQLYENQ